MFLTEISQRQSPLELADAAEIRIADIERA
jgi:hypothetical protein